MIITIKKDKNIEQIATACNSDISVFLGLMVFNATFNNISVISWYSVSLVEYPKKTTDLLQVTDKNNVVSSTPRLSGIRTHNVCDDRH